MEACANIWNGLECMDDKKREKWKKDKMIATLRRIISTNIEFIMHVLGYTHNSPVSHPPSFLHTVTL
jgi:hypothetical protein